MGSGRAGTATLAAQAPGVRYALQGKTTGQARHGRRPSFRRLRADTYDASSIEVLEGLEPVRKRPGMYIGGTDERALHHLVAEILDNSMDEAVAGHATRIEVELHADRSRHRPRQRARHAGGPASRSSRASRALEVIHCTLHAGGKFSGNAYQTSGGLHGVGASVVNALSDLHGRAGRAQQGALRAAVLARRPAGARCQSSARRRTGAGPPSTFHPDAEIFGHHRFARRGCFKMVRSKAYLFSRRRDPLEVRGRRRRDAAGGDRSTSPAASPTTWPRRWAAPAPTPTGPSPGTCRFPEKFGVARQGRVGDQLDARARRLPPVLLQHHPHARGRHARGRVLGRDPEGRHAPTASASRTARPRTSPARTCWRAAARWCRCFIREPEFVGQTKDRLATRTPRGWSRGRCATISTHWLAADTKSAGAILDFLVLRAEERLRRRQEKETARKTATKKLRLPGKLVDCSRHAPRGDRALHRRGRLGGRLGQDGARPRRPRRCCRCGARS